MMKDHSDDPHVNLCWLDLETTGLDSRSCAILEIGIVITDMDLDVIAERSWVIIPSKDVRISNINSNVWKMHTDNGIWVESLESSLPLNSAVYSASEFIERHGAKGSPLCGNTISFDRAFLKAQAPELLQSLHYRNVDVSTLKNVFALHFPQVHSFEKPKGNHRAIEDLHNSIAEYKHYLEWMRSGKLELLGL
jgi:oligoribonuclease